MDSLKEECKELQEKIKKLDHGRMWMENRLSALEGTSQYQTTQEKANMTNGDGSKGHAKNKHAKPNIFNNNHNNTDENDVVVMSGNASGSNPI